MPKVFIEKNRSKLLELVESNSLGTLVVSSAGEYDVNHLPFLVDSQDTGAIRLRAHLPKANPLCSLVEGAEKCVVIFNGADGYITPSWYATKKVHGKVVPTWNYSVVHMHGIMKIIDDSRWIYSQLTDLTNKNEKSRKESWKVTDAPADYIESQLKALVGLEIMVDRIEGKTKASQNQPRENKETILSALKSEQPDVALSKMMEPELNSGAA